MVSDLVKIRLNHRTRVIAFGVATPGFVLFSELSFLLISLQVDGGVATGLRNLANGLDRQGITSAILELMLVLFASLILGLAAQTIGFFFCAIDSPGSRFLKRAGRLLRSLAGKADADDESERISLTALVSELEDVFGAMQVRDGFQRHPIWTALQPPVGREHLAVDGALMTDATIGVPGEKASQDDRVFDNRRGHVFAYTKSWLSSNFPHLAVDAHEVQINGLFGSITPVAVAGLLPLRFVVPSGRAADWLAWAVCFLLVAFLLKLISQRGRGLQRDEHAVALRNFLFSEWFPAHEAGPGRSMPAAPHSGEPITKQEDGPSVSPPS